MSDILLSKFDTVAEDEGLEMETSGVRQLSRNWCEFKVIGFGLLLSVVLGNEKYASTLTFSLTPPVV